MSQQQRTKLMNRQTRAFTEGTVENINQQWIFSMMKQMRPAPLKTTLTASSKYTGAGAGNKE